MDKEAGTPESYSDDLLSGLGQWLMCSRFVGKVQLFETLWLDMRIVVGSFSKYYLLWWTYVIMKMALKKDFIWNKNLGL